MAFDPSDYAELSRKLVLHGDFSSEARVRASVSRAYYAVFLAVRTSIRAAEGRATHGRGDKIDHGKLPIALYATRVPRLEAIAKALEDLSAARRSADYELEPTSKYAAVCSKPSKAHDLVKRAQGTLREIAATDFTPVAGRLT